MENYLMLALHIWPLCLLAMC